MGRRSLVALTAAPTILALCLLAASLCAASPPVLSHAAVAPVVGWASRTPFFFSVTYQDPEGDPPLEAVLVVVAPGGGNEIEYPYTELGSVPTAEITRGVELKWSGMKFAAFGDYGFYFRAKAADGAAALGSRQELMRFHVKGWPDYLKIAGMFLAALILWVLIHLLVFIRAFTAPVAAFLFWLSLVLSFLGIFVWLFYTLTLTWIVVLCGIWLVALVIALICGRR